MQISAVLFDLDGTLLDTIGDICDAFNHVLSVHGYPIHNVAHYKSVVGYGARDAARQILPPNAQTPEVIEAVYGEYQEAYPLFNGKKTAPFPGIPELLGELSKRGIAMAVVSNKPQAATLACIAEYFPQTHFAAIHGHIEGVPLKPDPTSALRIAREMGLAPGMVAFVGDSDVDMKTAIAAGMQPIGVSWGYRSEAQMRAAGECEIVLSTQELLHKLISQQSA